MRKSSFDSLLGILGSVMHAHSACLFLKSQQAYEQTSLMCCDLVSAFSLGDTLNKTAHVHEGKGLVGWILRNNEPLLVSNFDQRQNLLGYYNDNEEQNIKAFMGCPLPNGLGVLCVDSKRQYSFAENDQKMLHLFAQLIAQMNSEVTLANEQKNIATYLAAQQAILELRHKHNRWLEFLDVFLHLIVSVTPFSYGALFILDELGTSFLVEEETAPLLRTKTLPETFPLSGGIVGWVFRHALPVFNSGDELTSESLVVARNGTAPVFHTITALPLVIHRKTRGVLCFTHDKSFAIDTLTKDFLKGGSEHLSLFLENLYVKNQLKKAYQELQQMNNE